MTRDDYWKAAPFLDIFWSVMSPNYSKWNMRARLSLHQCPILWLFIHGHTEKLNPTSLDFSHFFLLFLSSAAVVNFLLGSISVQEFSRKHYPNGKFLPRDKRTCRHMIQMRKICCNSSCHWKKKEKRHYFKAPSCNWM